MDNWEEEVRQQYLRKRQLAEGDVLNRGLSPEGGAFQLSGQKVDEERDDTIKKFLDQRELERQAQEAQMQGDSGQEGRPDYLSLAGGLASKLFPKFAVAHPLLFGALALAKPLKRLFKKWF